MKFTKTFQNQLEKWIDDGTKRQKFTLLFKASRDGCSITSFHNTCDNKGPTVTVLYNTNNTVYGGYTSVSWHSRGQWTADTKAFLFRLNYNGTFQPLKFPVKNAEIAICGDPYYGPIFGEGPDLYTFSSTVNKTGNYFPLNGSCNGKTYDMQGQDFNTFANGHMQVLDIEVYGVEVLLCVEKREYLQTPWRKNVDWTTQVCSHKDVDSH